MALCRAEGDKVSMRILYIGIGQGERFVFLIDKILNVYYYILICNNKYTF